MNIAPLEMQVVIPKSTEVGRVQQNRDHQEVVQQQHGAMQFQQMADQKLRQVQNSEKSEGKKVKDDERRKNNHGSSHGNSSQQDRQETPEEPKMAVDTFRGRNIDIKM